MRTRRNDNLLEALGRLPLFAGCNAAVVDTLADSSHTNHAGARERIYSQGDVASAFHVVLSGHVRRTILSSEGGEKLIEIVGPTQQLGLSEVFGAGRYVSTAETIGESTLLKIGRDGLVQAMRMSQDLSLGILAAVAEQQVALEQEIAATHFHSSCRRLVSYLLSLVDPPPDTVLEAVIVLPISKNLLAERIGVTPETLSRTFRDLADAGLISISGKTITLKTELTGRARDGTGTDKLALVDDQRGRHGRRRSDFWIDRKAVLISP